jgi:hypothetical protein
MIPKEAIREFRKIYKRKFGEWLDHDEALLKAENFLELMILITGGNGNEKSKP